MSEPLDDCFFAYGTLAPGRPNEHVLADLRGRWQPATVSGRLEQSGWGAALGYPALVPGRAGSVAGFLLTSPDLPGLWPELDAFEGEEYVRTSVAVRLDDGTSADAWAYVHRG